MLLIGYSRGADVLPFMASRLPRDLRESTQLIALLGLEPTIDFKYAPAWSLAAYTHKEPQFAVKPEVEKLRGQNVLCIFGAKEKTRSATSSTARASRSSPSRAAITSPASTATSRM